ncbi:MAG: hypothetical protein Q4A31_06405 [Corynebacterium sp.]|uniref:hypothetical protein n=1 Tax=Corynebacterium sp. TaxID=1720 RepID=UPI0026DD118C|nr:hypothetical protein [Corynebacterium sp.]MDO4761529.1 hypothetical protein [Corynebacterium sp.]
MNIRAGFDQGGKTVQIPFIVIEVWKAGSCECFLQFTEENARHELFGFSGAVFGYPQYLRGIPEGIDTLIVVRFSHQ